MEIKIKNQKKTKKMQTLVFKSIDRCKVIMNGLKKISNKK